MDNECVCEVINRAFGRTLVDLCAVCGRGMDELRAVIAVYLDNPGALRAQITRQQYINRPVLKRGSKPLIGDKR